MFSMFRMCRRTKWTKHGHSLRIAHVIHPSARRSTALHRWDSPRQSQSQTATANRRREPRVDAPIHRTMRKTMCFHRAEPRPGEFFVDTFGLFVDGPFPVLCVASTCDETSLTYTHLHSHSSSLSHTTFNHSSSFRYHSSTVYERAAKAYRGVWSFNYLKHIQTLNSELSLFTWKLTLLVDKIVYL